MTIWEVRMTNTRYELRSEDKWTDSTYFSDRGYAENYAKSIIKQLNEDHVDIDVEHEFDGTSYECWVSNNDKQIEIQINEITVNETNILFDTFI